MISDLQKSKKELIETLKSLKIRSAEAESSQTRLKDMQTSYHELQERFETHFCFSPTQTQTDIDRNCRVVRGLISFVCVRYYL